MSAAPGLTAERLATLLETLAAEADRRAARVELELRPHREVHEREAAALRALAERAPAILAGYPIPEGSVRVLYWSCGEPVAWLRKGLTWAHFAGGRKGVAAAIAEAGIWQSEADARSAMRGAGFSVDAIAACEFRRVFAMAGAA